jgi:hypothetical protein
LRLALRGKNAPVRGFSSPIHEIKMSDEDTLPTIPLESLRPL